MLSMWRLHYLHSPPNQSSYAITVLQLVHTLQTHKQSALLPTDLCLQLADEEDDYIGSLDLCSIDEDYDQNCDVTAVDRFHGLRVAHPVEALTLGQGMTVGRDASCGLVLDEPSVGCQPNSLWY